jgi:transposase
LPPAASDYFVARVEAAVPAELKPTIQPLLEQIAGLTIQIRHLDQTIEKLAERYPEIRILRTVPGVGPVIAAAYVLTLNGSDGVAHSRSLAAFLGLRPRQR